MLFPHKNKLRNCCFYLRICWHQLSLMLMLGWSLINKIVSYHVYNSKWNINIHFAEILSRMMSLYHILSSVIRAYLVFSITIAMLHLSSRLVFLCLLHWWSMCHTGIDILGWCWPSHSCGDSYDCISRCVSCSL